MATKVVTDQMRNATASTIARVLTLRAAHGVRLTAKERAFLAQADALPTNARQASDRGESLG